MRIQWPEHLARSAHRWLGSRSVLSLAVSGQRWGGDDEARTPQCSLLTSRRLPLPGSSCCDRARGADT